MRIEGIVGTIELRLVKGWAKDETEEPLELSLYIDDELVQTTKANILRKDLVENGIHKTGKCGFEFRLQDRLIIDASNLVVKYNNEVLRFSNNIKNRIKNAIIIPDVKRVNGEDTFFFIHIPKTAGTSFKKMFESEFDLDEIYPNEQDVLKNNGLYPNINTVVNNKDRIEKTKLLLGHYPYITGKVLGKNANIITFLRDPIKRVISNIYHMKQYDKRFANSTPEQIYNSGIWHYQNLQTRYLCDNHDGITMRFNNNRPLHRPALKRALINLEKIPFVGITERFDESIMLFNKQFNFSLGKTITTNKSKVKKTVSEKLKQRIKRNNQLDIELYNTALEKFDASLKSHLITI